MKMSNEMIKKAKAAQSASELLHMAHEHGMEMTDAEAQRYFDMLHPTTGELADDELDNVSGGGCGGGGKKDDANDAPQYLFNIGDRVVYASNPNAVGVGTVDDRRCYEGECQYSVVFELSSGPLYWIAEDWLKKYEG